MENNLLIPDLVQEFINKAKDHISKLSSVNSLNATRLREVLSAVNPVQLQKGDLVQMNPLLQNDIYPIGDQVGIVMELMPDSTHRPTNGHLSANVFFDKLDVKVAFVNEGNLHTALLPSWRLNKYEEKAV